MYITTVDIGMSSGWVDEQGNMCFENNWGDTGNATWNGSTGTVRGGFNFCGIANLKSGAQSLIGRIIATRPIKHTIQGWSVNCYEIYATDWINPASINNEYWSTVRSNIMTFSSSNTPKTSANATFFKVPHGAGVNEYNYQVNPSFNNINGAFNQKDLSTTSDNGGFISGQASGVPNRMNYTGLANDGGGWNKQVIVKNGSVKTNPSELEVGLGIPQGLSFPYNGSYCGALFFGGFKTTADPGYNGLFDSRYRANANSYWHWTSGNGGGGVKGELYAHQEIYDEYLNHNAGLDESLFVEGGGLMPMCWGRI